MSVGLLPHLLCPLSTWPHQWQPSQLPPLWVRDVSTTTLRHVVDCQSWKNMKSVNLGNLNDVIKIWFQLIIFYCNFSRKSAQYIFHCWLTIRHNEPEVETGVFLALHGVSNLRNHTSGTIHKQTANREAKGQGLNSWLNKTSHSLYNQSTSGHAVLRADDCKLFQHD